MPDLVSVLKAEIGRLARKEVKSETAVLKRAMTGYRRDIAALKRQVAELERRMKQLGRAPKASPIETADEADGLRFRAGGFAQHRKRLGLSAAEMGRLLGTSGQSVYKWELGKARPRRSYLPAIAALRKMGKREAAERLEQLAA